MTEEKSEEKLLEIVKEAVYDYIMEHLGCTTEEIIANIGIDASPSLITEALEALAEAGGIERATIIREGK